MSHSIQCVHCKAILKSAQAVPAGKKIKCPKCQQVFTSGARDLEIPDRPLIEPGDLLSEDDEMARAIAKLEIEQAGGKKPAPAVEPKPAPAAAPSPAVSHGAMSEDDEMDAAIAKLEIEQAAGNKPAPAVPKPAPPSKPAPVEEEIPEIDDDLVVPDEDEAPKKQTPSKKTAPPPIKSKKSRAEEVEDDEPPVKKVKKARDEVDEDDEPRAKKKRDPDEEDAAFSDRPSSKKRKDRDDDEDDDRNVDLGKNKAKKKSGSPMMLILLVGGGVLGLLACCGCSIGGYFLFLSNPVVGRWESDMGFGIKMRWEFFRDGTGKLDVGEGSATFDYTVSGSNPTILELRNPRAIGKGLDLRNNDNRPLRLRATFQGDTMTLTNEQVGGFGGQALTLRRVS